MSPILHSDPAKAGELIPKPPQSGGRRSGVPCPSSDPAPRPRPERQSRADAEHLRPKPFGLTLTYLEATSPSPYRAASSECMTIAGIAAMRMAARLISGPVVTPAKARSANADATANGCRISFPASPTRRNGRPRGSPDDDERENGRSLRDKVDRLRDDGGQPERQERPRHADHDGDAPWMVARHGDAAGKAPAASPPDAARSPWKTMGS